MEDEQAPTTHQLLKELNRAVKAQMSVWYILKTGVIYGVGFVIGSTIVATIAINASLLIFGDFPAFRAIVELAKLHP